MISIVDLNNELCDVDKFKKGELATGVYLETDDISIVIAPYEWSSIMNENTAAQTISGVQTTSAWGGHGIFVDKCNTVENVPDNLNCLKLELNGEKNTNAIIEHLKGIKDEYYDNKQYIGAPAAEYCKIYYNGAYGEGEWYLPSSGEMYHIMENVDEINKAMDKISGWPLKEVMYTPYRLWTSTQSCRDSAWMCYIGENKFFPDCKCTPGSVRPICKYKK